MSIEEVLDRPGLHGTRWSVVLAPSSGAPLAHRPDLLLPTASVAKVLLLVEVARRLHEGSLDATAPLDRRRVPPVGDSGLWQRLHVDRLALDDVALLVGTVSDNVATNVLLDVVGLEAVAATGERLAPGGSRLLDVVRDARGPDDPEMLSRGCAADWARITADLHAGRVVGPRVSAQVLGWLAASVDHSMVAGGLGLDPLAHDGPDRGLRLWHKTGTDDGVRADVGVVEGPTGTCAYAAIAGWDPGAGEPREEVLDAMRDLGRLVRELVGAGRDPAV